MTNPLIRILDWYRNPVQDPSGTSHTALGVLPSREATTDIVAHLIERGYTPATEADVRDAFSHLFDRDATPFEELVALDYVDSFGLLAR
ncbi:hypothetical protein [Corynebacterium sp.]|jgi:hypothetical protein|uniref:hypothetical protein n=1 Tax=Corynebacterium sp. TaxID=1720 RepID=UPI0025C2B77D|nr:hypothetical protein [Corynebacterium sp.]